MREIETRFRDAYDALLEEMPDPPSFHLISTVSIEARGKTQRFRWLTATSSAAVVLLLVSGLALLMDRDSISTRTTQPVIGPNTTVGTASEVFVPPIQTSDGETVLDLVLLDGTKLTVSYPADIDLTSLGVEAQTVGHVNTESRGFGVRYGSPAALVESLGSGKLTATFPGADGGVVERWEFPGIVYLVFDFDPWTAYLSYPVSGLDEIAQAVWSRSLHGSITNTGYLTLTADRPLELVEAVDEVGPDGPDIRVDGESGGLLVFLDDCDRMNRLDDEVYGSEVFAFCDQPTNTLFFVTGDAEVQERLHDTLKVSLPESGNTTTTLPAEPGELDWVLPWSLVFDSGLSSVIAVNTRDLTDPSSSTVEGLRPGDPPYRVSVVDGRLIVGWGGIYAHDIATRQSTKIGEATIYVPAAEPDRIWLVDYPGGRINTAQPPLVWQVLADGTQLSTPVRFEVDDVPSIGIPGGLAADSEDGIVLWSYATGEVIERLGSGLAFVSDVSSDAQTKLAWCEDPCPELHVTTLGGADLVFDSPGQVMFDARSARFSPDGRYVAAPAASDIILIDLADGGDMTSVLTIEDQWESNLVVGWAPTGSVLFASTLSYQQPQVTIGYHDAVTGESQVATLPYGGTLSFVVLDTNDAVNFFH